jgi:hypothetical protein
VQVALALALTGIASGATRAENAAADGVVVNIGTEPIDVDLVELSAPPLALEIVDAAGVPLRMLSPPTPGRPHVVSIAPGEQRTVPFRAFVPPSAPPGRYRVRFRYHDTRSDWVDIVIA